ncbi:MAG: hypothetical protein Q4G05_04165 [Clostridia bacterium]|nr:hypothetical protein [Clostridia bacterium]
MKKLLKFSCNPDFYQNFELYINQANKLFDNCSNSKSKTISNKFDSLFKKKYAYFMIKPDGARYFYEILQLLNSFFIQPACIYLFPVKNWENLSKVLYSNHFQSQNFKNNFQANCITTTTLFGNYSIIGLIEIETQNYTQILEKVYLLKTTIREKFMAKDISIFYRLDDNTSISSILNIIHCPDPNIRILLDEMNILNEFRIFYEPINSEIFNKILRYQSFSFLKDILNDY